MNTAKERDFLFDNLKGWLLLLVVFGHAIEYANYRSSGIIKYLYTTAYLFHMPVFIFVSGYFSKKKNNKKLISFSITYLIWQMLIYPIGLSLLTSTPYIKNYRPFYYPQVSYWYLMAIIIWRFITPYLHKIKYIIPISIIFSLLFGFLNLDINLQHYTIGRLVVFYPFFLYGYMTDKSKIKIWLNKNKRISFLSFITLITLGTIMIHGLAKHGVNPERMNRILMPHYWYSECYHNVLLSLTVKIILLIIGFISIPLCFNITIKNKTWLSIIGQNSLYIYLSHMIIIEAVRINYLKNVSFNTGTKFLILALILSIAYSILLARSTTLYNNLKNKLLRK